MDIETAANPADAPIDTPVEAVTQEATTQAEGESNDFSDLAKEALGEVPAANPEFIVVEIDGKKLKVLMEDGSPVDPDLKFGAMKEADYRRKTAELSEQRKAVEAEREAIELRANLQGDAALRARDLSALEAQINRVSQISIDELRQQGWTDQQIGQAQAELVEMAKQRDDLKRQVAADTDKLKSAWLEEMSATRQKARSEATIIDRALTPERIDSLEGFLKGLNIPGAEPDGIDNPGYYQLLHWADIGKKFIERQRTAERVENAQASQPVPQIGGKSNAGKDPNKMSDTEWMKWREDQLKRRA